MCFMTPMKGNPSFHYSILCYAFQNQSRITMLSTYKFNFFIKFNNKVIIIKFGSSLVVVVVHQQYPNFPFKKTIS